MKVFHRTSPATAAVILASGFQDGEGAYLTNRVWRGVWVSDVPLDADEGALGELVLALDIPSELFAEYEWVEDGKNYRESLIPAVILNRYPPPTIVPET